MAHKRASIGKLARDARQEQRAALASAKNEAVAIGFERVHEFGFASRRDRSRMRENRDVEAEPGKFAFLERGKKRIGEARLRRIGDHTVDERPPRRGRADAAARSRSA